MLCGMSLDNKIINMNNIINKFLLAGDKFMPEMHLRQPQFVYSAFVPFTRHKERIKEFKRTGDTRLLYRNELDKACFKHDAAYVKYKDVENRLISDQKLRNSAYFLIQKLLHSTKKLCQVKVMQSIRQSLVL